MVHFKVGQYGCNGPKSRAWHAARRVDCGAQLDSFDSTPHEACLRSIGEEMADFDGQGPLCADL